MPPPRPDLVTILEQTALLSSLSRAEFQMLAARTVRKHFTAVPSTLSLAIRETVSFDSRGFVVVAVVIDVPFMTSRSTRLRRPQLHGISEERGKCSKTLLGRILAYFANAFQKLGIEARIKNRAPLGALFLLTQQGISTCRAVCP